MIPRRFRRALGNDSRGATLVEFAFIATPLFLLLVGTLDLGYRMYMNSILQGIVHQAARQGTLEDQDGDAIDAYVRAAVANLSSAGVVSIARRNYTEFTGVAQPEKITQDTDPVGGCNPGDWYLDANSNSQYDSDRGRDGQGGADDIIQYTVAVEYPRFIKLGGMFGTSDTITLRANTVMQNQPYAANPQADTVERQVTSC